MKTTKSKQEVVKLSDIKVNPSQPRTLFNETELQELAASIRDTGLLQPIGLNRIKGELFLIYGERRLRASHIVQTEIKERNTIAAVIFDNLSAAAVKEMQIIENLHRKDISPMEEAVAYQKLLELKKADIKEIANRVSKSISYVAQRLKLNDLINEFQDALFSERITLTSALKLSKIPQEGQQELWEHEFAKLAETDFIEIEDWAFKMYMNDLKKASFDIADTKLCPKAGSCLICPFNTAVNTLLFPDEANKATCTNAFCFQEKTKLALNKGLKEALENPNIELVSTSYEGLGDTAKELINSGHKVYGVREYTAIGAPATPIMAEYEEEFENEGYNSLEEMQEAFKEAIKDYENDLLDFETKTASGKYLKAFVVEGNHKGKYLYISFDKQSNGEIKLSAKALQEKLKNETVTEEDFTAEVKRINDKEIRSKELDEEKTQPLIYKALAEHKPFQTNTEVLIKEEKIAIILLMQSYLGYHYSNEIAKLVNLIGGDDSFRKVNLHKTISELSPEKLDEVLHLILRKIMLDKMKPSNGQRPSNSGTQAALRDLALAYNKEGVEAVWNTQMKVRTKREGKIKERVDILNHKANLLKQPKQLEKKAA
ncbi:MAG TPA: ParB/RepB/Spo0J family partition protein [Bacteroidia bacterium]